MEEIPGPRAWPILGNMLDVRSDEGITKAFESLADIYGPVFQVTLRGRKTIIVSSAEVLMQITDEKTFVKTPSPALDDGEGPRGLFLARSEDPDWGQAHRILMPAFGPLSVETMFEEMKDIASQLCLKWARMGEETQILLTDDFTRLTLDTIALCTMDFRFNSFYRDDMHPFVDAMTSVLAFAGKRGTMPWIYNVMNYGEQAKFRQDNETMRRVAQEIVNHRRTKPSDRSDFLDNMLYGTDPKSGAPMRDELIAVNMLTFLIAGHETTSGLLSFAFMHLLKNPKAYLKAQQEIDAVVGNGCIEAKHLKQLKYLNAVLRETVRLTPTVTGITKIVHPDRRNETITFCDGRYIVDPKTPIRVLFSKAMSDPAYFGEDAKDFNPDRMIESNPAFDHYMKAWKPFGNGSRSCIGQHFAWQEALLVAAAVLQNFDMSFVDAGYELHLNQTLTVKPRDLYVKVKLRKGITPTSLGYRFHGSGTINVAAERQPSSGTATEKTKQEGLTILYGSNSGTCHSLAQKLGSAAATQFGIKISIYDMDSGIEMLSRDHPVVIITASYEGQPPDNAARFVEWLETSTSTSLQGVKYSVFGSGHRDWHETFHRIPKLIDKTLEERGADRIYELGTTDVSIGHVLDDFDVWQEGLMKVIQALAGISAPREIDAADQAEIRTDLRASQLSNGLTVAKVKDVRILTGPGQPEKYHMEIELPIGSTYDCGDYLAVLPINPDSLVKKIMAHWQLPWDSTITLKTKAFAPLPDHTVLSIYDILKGYFELSQPASKKDLECLKKHAVDKETIAQVDALNDNALFEADIAQKRVSLFQYLVKHPDIKLPFPDFLSRLMPLRVRQYSISSSPMAQPTSCTITYSVIKGSDTDSTDTFEGVSTNFLSRLQPGDNIQISLKQTATAKSRCPFRLPVDPNTPMVMFCAGTGLAPFRGFIQQRATMLEANKDLRLAPAILFVGCRSSTQDRLYAEELDRWAKIGAVNIRYAFSQEPHRSLGCKYISDRMVHDAEDISEQWRQDARLYVCGSRAVLEAVGRAAKQIFEAATKNATEAEKDERKAKFESVRADRVVTDIFD